MSITKLRFIVPVATVASICAIVLAAPPANAQSKAQPAPAKVVSSKATKLPKAAKPKTHWAYADATNPQTVEFKVRFE